VNDNPTPETLYAVGALGFYTNGSFSIRKLSGRTIRLRSRLMTVLLGKQIPENRCGVNALTEAFYAAAGVPKDLCAARQADEFAKWCKAQLERKLTCQNC